MDWSELALTLAGTAISIAIPVTTPFVVALLKARTHSTDVAIWQEAAVNAAGRVILSATSGLQRGTLTRANLPDFINDQVQHEANHVIKNLIPGVTNNLNKTQTDAVDTVNAKLGNSIGSLGFELPGNKTEMQSSSSGG